MKVLTIVGARPQLIKAAAVSRVLRRAHREFLVHTGQHYDYGMSEIFFRELGIPDPDVNLGIGSGGHGAQTGAMLAAIEPLIERERPDWALVFGDTNSTLAGALAAAKLHVPVAHVEAGVRSGNWRMPEEINRVLTDAAADLLLAPTGTALTHLAREAVHGRVVWVGDVMLDALKGVDGAADGASLLSRMGVERGGYLVATLHRAETVDDAGRLENVLSALASLDMPAIVPLHPRTRKRISEFGLERFQSPGWVEPLGYLDMMNLVRNAALVLTDSGGLQKEAGFLGIPCVTLREETEWPETLESGWNRLAGTDPERIAAAVADVRSGRMTPIEDLHGLFGGGIAAERVVRAMEAGPGLSSTAGS